MDAAGTVASPLLVLNSKAPLGTVSSPWRNASPYPGRYYGALWLRGTLVAGCANNGAGHSLRRQSPMNVAPKPLARRAHVSCLRLGILPPSWYFASVLIIAVIVNFRRAKSTLLQGMSRYPYSGIQRPLLRRDMLQRSCFDRDQGDDTDETFQECIVQECCAAGAGGPGMHRALFCG